MSLELVNKLRRHRSRVDNDIADMDNRIAERSTGRADEFMKRETEERIKSIEHIMESVMQRQRCGSTPR